MSDQTSSIHTITVRQWFTIGAIGLLLVLGAHPGEVITLTADCQCPSALKGTEPDATAKCCLVVRSPVMLDRPVFLTYGWKWTSTTKNGEKITYTDEAAQGMLVRAFVVTSEGTRLVDGVLTDEGKVVVNGTAYELADMRGPTG